MEDVIQEAETQLEQGYIEKAEILLKQIIRESTDDKTRGQAALQAGKLLLIQEDYDEALTLFQQAVGDLPDDARTHFYVGVAYRHREQWQAALEAFDRADTLQPNDAAILAQRGGVQFQLSQAAQAKALLNEALRLDPTRTKTQLDRAVVYTSEGDFVAALSCAIQADRLDPGNPAVEETIHTIQELQYRFEDSTHIASIRRSLPRSRKDWERWISTVTSPTELVSSLLEHTHPKSQKDLQALAQRAFDEWNRCPRPELGGISPEQASKRTPKPSDVEDAQTYPWLTVDNMWAENNPVRRDIVAFLTHLDEANYKATASLGNLPLKGVRGVNDLLTQPAQLKHMVGNEVISEVRLVSDVWSIFFLQGLVMANDLAVFEPGRRITLTEQGHRFLISSPARQLWLSLYAWWWVTDWGMAYSWEVFEDFYQSGLSVFSLRVLRGIPVGKRVQVDDFVNIIANMLHTNHVHVNPTLFKSAIKFMILNVLEDFEIITHKKKAKKTSGIPIEEVIWFKVTPFGHQLLRSI